MKTGYFARATEEGHRAKSTQVHIVDNYGKSLCRYRPHLTMKFQWCSGGVNLSYVECKECRKNYLIKEYIQNKKSIEQITKELKIGSYIKTDKYAKQGK